MLVAIASLNAQCLVPNWNLMIIEIPKKVNTNRPKKPLPVVVSR